MKYTDLSYHYRPKKGWMNDPNGLVYFQGYYHAFYQHAPNHELPWKEPMHWGHARTKDFLHWEELPVALYPDTPYDKGGCFSGTATVKEDTLYLIYSSIQPTASGSTNQAVSVAYSKDGIHFEKYEKNPVIAHYPPQGGPDFRDPAICFANGSYYCVMATGNPESQEGRLLLYRSDDLFNWAYDGIMSKWSNCKYTECPSLVHAENGKYLLSASVCPLDRRHYFSVMYGDFVNGAFQPESVFEIDKGPDQYAGQIFQDHKGRNILISWLPGWRYRGYAERDIGCLSVPKELVFKNGKLCGFPVEELQHLLKDTDDAVKITNDGFIIERTGREPVVYQGPIRDLKILRDSYLVEVFLNGGEEIYTALL